MSFMEDYGHFLLLGAGVVAIAAGSQRKTRKLEKRAGEECDPNNPPPSGYQCGQIPGGWELMEESGHFTGFGSYINAEAVTDALESLGFPNGDLAGYQAYFSLVYEGELRRDGIVDKDSLVALKEGENMLAREEWSFPNGAGR